MYALCNNNNKTIIKLIVTTNVTRTRQRKVLVWKKCSINEIPNIIVDVID